MKRLNIDKDLFESYAKEHTLVELACEFNITKQQAKDYSHHNKIKYKLVEERHYCSNSKLYTVWKSMLSRCENPKAKDFYRYGGRGIKVYADWHNVKSFIDWCLSNGYKEGLQLDRIYNDKDYCPDNCRFVTPKDNMKNRHNTLMYNGIPLADLLNNSSTNPYNLERHTVWYRLKKLNWSVEKALNTPLKY